MVLYSLKYGRRFLDEVLSSFKKISHLPSALYLQRNIYTQGNCAIYISRMRRNKVSERASFSGKYTGGSGIQKRWYILADEITRTNDHLLCICSYFLFVQAHGGISAGTCCSMLLLLRKRIISKTNLASLLLYAIARSTPAATLLIKQTLFQYVVLGISYLSV